jgi:5'-methylthioadenosine/S-adenosylhomocysteine nucleosidase
MLKNPNLTKTPNSDIFQVNNKVDIAIFSAMKEEMEYIENAMCNYVRTVKVYDFNFNIYDYQGKKVLLASTGFGTTFLASVLTLVYQNFSPDYVFLTGTSGGVRSDLNIRDVVIAEKAFEAEVQTVFNSVEGTPFESCLIHPLNNKKFPHIYSANAKLLDIAKSTFINDTAINIGIVVSSNAFPSPLNLYESIKLNDPLSIDMETSAFYQISWLLNIPALAIRGISNKLKSNGTDDKIHESDLNGSSKTASVALLKIIDHLIYTFEINLKESNSEIKDLITSLNLKPHPEG